MATKIEEEGGGPTFSDGGAVKKWHSCGSGFPDILLTARRPKTSSLVITSQGMTNLPNPESEGHRLLLFLELKVGGKFKCFIFPEFIHLINYRNIQTGDPPSVGHLFALVFLFIWLGTPVPNGK